MSDSFPEADKRPNNSEAPGISDPASSLRAAALLTLKTKRRKPDTSNSRPPPRVDNSFQLDYGQMDPAPPPSSDVDMSLAASLKVPKSDVELDGQSREEGEISDSEDPASKTAPITAREITSSAQVDSPRPSATKANLNDACIIGPDRVRPGLYMNQTQYDTAKDIVLDLLGWGVPPDYLVDCNLSRELIFYVFSELNLRLPQNLDVTGLVPYTPAYVAAHSRPLSVVSSSPRSEARSQHPSLPQKPGVDYSGAADVVADPPVLSCATKDESTDGTLHDIERQRREELLARKAIQVTRKVKPSSDASSIASSSADYDVEMPLTIPTEAVEDFLKTIGEKSLSPEIKTEPMDSMEIDDIPGLGGNNSPVDMQGNVAGHQVVTSPTDSMGPPTTEPPEDFSQRRNGKRPSAADFVDLDVGPRNGHSNGRSVPKAPVPIRKTASFASISGHRKLVIDLSDESDGDDEAGPACEEDAEVASRYSSPGPGRMPASASSGRGSPPVPPQAGTMTLVEKEEEIRKMREMIAQRERNRLNKSTVDEDPGRVAIRPVDVNSASTQTRLATQIPPKPGEGHGACDEYEHFTQYESSLARYPLLGGHSTLSLSNPSFSSSIPSVPNLLPLKQTSHRTLDPGKRICQYELPGGGVCRDAECKDIHLSRIGREKGPDVLEPSDDDTAEYLGRALSQDWIHAHAVTVAGITAALARTDHALALEDRNFSYRISWDQVTMDRTFPDMGTPGTPGTLIDNFFINTVLIVPRISLTLAPMRKRARVDLAEPIESGVSDNAFIADHDAMDSAGDDDDDDDKPKSGQKQGRRKIKIEFIQDKSRRHITFSKRKAVFFPFRPLPTDIVQAYELSTLTGTQVLLLVVSETGLVYTFTTAKLQPLVTQPEGKNLIQACLNAPHGTLPSAMPVGPPIGRAGPMGGPGGPPVANNLPGGLSISGGANTSSSKDDDDGNDEDESAHTGDKRRRHSSAASASSTGPGASSSNSRGATSPHPTTGPPPLSIPSGGPPQGGPSQHPQHAGPPSQISIGSPTSPQQAHAPSAPPSAQYSSGQTAYSHHQPQPQHHQQHDQNQMYPSHMMNPTSYQYPPGGGAPPTQGQAGGQQLTGLAAAAAQHSHWQNPQGPVQGAGYGRRQ
ncbi:unnamed protein product [Mycena citricolor]|uniref:MADS-box domain-containing protein n=1 Tax=Mycena citricolor TaxID=2018698 RepID=A0AAD2I0I1_9AGAR|nr:unnamed protein product [Mycena citricolor]